MRFFSLQAPALLADDTAEHTAPTPSGSPPEAAGRAFTGRAILIGLLLIPVNCYWVTVIEVRWYMLDGSCLPLFVTPVFILFVLTVLNLGVLRLNCRLALSGGELLVVYVMLVVSNSMCGHDMIQNLFGVIAHPFRFADPENKWATLFLDQVPRWLFISDEQTLRDFYEGSRGAGLHLSSLRMWLGPLAHWFAFILTLTLMMLAAAFLLSRPWTREEKLSYPIIQVPLRLTEQQGKVILRNRAMWLGFALAAAADILNGLHSLYPNVPELKIKQTPIGDYFTRRPLDAIQGTTVSFYPFMIGLVYFLPQDLSFSCWFFFVLRKAEQVLGRALGWEQVPGFPFFNEQASGAWLGLALVALYGVRRHLLASLRHALGRASHLAGRERRMPYRVAFVLLIIGSVYLLLFSRAMGMTFEAASLFFVLYFLLSLAMTRVRAELGTPHEIYFVNPQQIMVQVLGARALGLGNLVGIACTYWFNRCYRCHPMPNQVEAFKMGEERRFSGWALAATLALALVASLLASFWANLAVTYKNGAIGNCLGFKDWVGWESFDRLAFWIQNPQGPDWTRISFMGLGMALVFGLRGARGAWVSLPLHPAGYALAISFAMDYFWFAFFVSWLIKSALLRYGGLKLYHHSVPFFLGLILGDYVTGSCWALIGPALGRETYKIFI